MSAQRRQEKMASGKVAVNIKGALTKSGGTNKASPIKNAVGMCGVGGGGYHKIKGAVSG